MYNEDFKVSVYNFFKHVKKNNIGKIVIDIRNSPGGTSDVINELATYLGVGGSKGELVQKIHEEQLLYNGKVYVLISKETFSSANALAAIFKYYNIGILVGESTGNSTLAYGNPKQYILPNSKIKYNVATIEVKLPSEDQAKAIEPDIPIHESIEDFLNNSDPVMEWIYEQ